jgi:hypothetical protein
MFMESVYFKGTYYASPWPRQIGRRSSLSTTRQIDLIIHPGEFTHEKSPSIMSTYITWVAAIIFANNRNAYAAAAVLTGVRKPGAHVQSRLRCKIKFFNH